MNVLKKTIMIFGLEYSVLWSVIIYFLWDDGPLIFTILDAVAGIVILKAGYDIYQDKPVVVAGHSIYRYWLWLSLIYNSVWTLVIMLFLGIDLNGFGEPLDLLSLYTTGSLSYRIWKAPASNVFGVEHQTVYPDIGGST